MRSLKLALLLAGASAAWASVSRAEEADSGLRYLRTFASSSVGRGLRFNNPYRLRTQLGDGPESLSLTASYFDLGLGVSAGDPHGLEHGAVAHLSFALDGISQEVGSLSYLALLPFGRDFIASARAGVPVVFAPDFSVGLELGVGATWLVTGGIGVTAELVPSLFFGAATWEADPTLVPMVSLQLGGYVEYELLP